MRAVRILIIAAAVVAATTTIRAQDDGPGLITKSFRVAVKADRFLQFEDAFREHLQWHQKNNDTWGWHCSSSTSTIWAPVIGNVRRVLPNGWKVNASP